ncbi:hypothetical protein LTR53_015012 [Teratosphaeriaceae sp. CCFEE 6253]|nr:hypothetical protein LTR53_015012 [Teratosphaeriaceae sp. CCFEE 6253]
MSMPLMPPSTNGVPPLESGMPYSCQACSKRKVKCDKTAPRCGSCTRGELACIYQAPPPRRRKRKLSGGGDAGLNEKVLRYEQILQQHGLLPQPPARSPTDGDHDGDGPREPLSLLFMEREVSRTGKLVAGQGKSRYLNSGLWHTLEDDDVPQVSDGEEAEEHEDYGQTIDPFTGAFMGHQQSLTNFHPNPTQAMILWKTHVDQVEPICKILHIPTVAEMIKTVTQQPATATKAEECLLFSIYHFAVFSMTPTECSEKLAQDRAPLLQSYHFAARQALVNASFLKSTEMTIMQALILFLIPCRQSYNPQVFWILTGIAVRIAQRMGLHRDGLDRGLSPFDIQMRRRLFYQLAPLDGGASRMTGTGIGMMPDTWDTKPPLNLNDDQISPEMTEMPEEERGATEMIFCLSRASLGAFFAKFGVGGPSAVPIGRMEAEQAIRETEETVESRFLRYCDIIDPLHFLTMVTIRSAITNMRMRVALPKHKWKTATDDERREFFGLAQKILDTDIAACAHSSLKKFQWHVSVFFVWGSWDSLIFTLTTLRKPDILSPAELDAAWTRIEQIYANHSKELLVSMQALQVAIGRLTLKAWEARVASGLPDPAFITTLRASRRVSPRKRGECQESFPSTISQSADTLSPFGMPSGEDPNAWIGGNGVEMAQEFNLDDADWMFWDQLIQDHQTKGG